jgi:TM2 domain-containing membrane protein YozV
VKRHVVSTLLSGIVFPGAGQIYNGDYIKGALLIGLSLLFLFGFIFFFIGGFVLAIKNAEMGYADFWDFVRTGIACGGRGLAITFFALLLLWLFAMIDAYFSGRGVKGG